jgi:hypothetical protein
MGDTVLTGYSQKSRSTPIKVTCRCGALNWVSRQPAGPVKFRCHECEKIS